MAAAVTRQLLLGGINDAPTAAGTEYASIWGGNSSNTWATTESWRRGKFPIAGQISGFRVEIDTAPTGSGKTITYTVMKNGSATTQAVTLTDAETSGITTGAPVDYAAGDDISLRVTMANTPSLPTNQRWSMVFTPTATKRFVMIGGTGGGLGAAAGTLYSPIEGYTWNATDTARRTLIAVNGTIRSWRLTLSGAPDSGVTYVVSIRKNGVEETTTRLTYTSPSTGFTVSGLNIDVAPGDLIDLMCVTTGTVTNNRFARWGIEIEPDTDGESQINGLAQSPTTGTTQYAFPTNASGFNWNTTEANRTALGGGSYKWILRNLRFDLSTAPGATKSWTFRIRKNGADGNSTVTIADTATTGTDGSNTDTFESGDEISISKVPTNTPTSTTRVAFAAAMFIDVQENAVTKGLVYRVSREISAIAKTLAYRVIYEHAALTKGLIYRVSREMTPISKTLVYRVSREITAITKGLAYEVTTEVPITKGLTYMVSREVSAITKGMEYVIQSAFPELVQKDLEYRVTVERQITKGMDYEVLSEAVIQKGLTYKVTNEVPAIQKGLIYRVIREIGAITKGLIYRVTTEQGITKGMTYTVQREVSAITKGLSYEILSEVGVTKGMTYRVTTEALISKGMVYRVQAEQSAITKSLVYRVIREVSAIVKGLTYLVTNEAATITKPLQYTVLSEQRVEKGLEYTIQLQENVQKTLEYRVSREHVVTKGMTYALRFNPYSKKTSPYSRKNSPFSRAVSPITRKESPYSKRSGSPYERL